MKVAIEAAKSLINASGILSHIGAGAFSDQIGEEVPPSGSR
jgi:hypothetical protein